MLFTGAGSSKSPGRSGEERIQPRPSTTASLLISHLNINDSCRAISASCTPLSTVTCQGPPILPTRSKARPTNASRSSSAKLNTKDASQDLSWLSILPSMHAWEPLSLAAAMTGMKSTAVQAGGHWGAVIGARAVPLTGPAWTSRALSVLQVRLAGTPSRSAHRYG
ncbi:hypothetical protein B0H67DRAFT_256581 [Lasiosphaeris hirsuta]|uniref:Uncharacterized protein n=1 Tax=Lasiosphaeris hirsuta TaxID=260670 RepID=A0AA40DUH3_9PEZI|nr:hypothetical protein B0H67DRAFT_256581 [Lasiosphaeris hirsuta]